MVKDWNLCEEELKIWILVRKRWNVQILAKTIDGFESSVLALNGVWILAWSRENSSLLRFCKAVVYPFPWIDNCLMGTKLLKVGCIPYAVGKQPSIPWLILEENRRWIDDDNDDRVRQTLTRWGKTYRGKIYWSIVCHFMHQGMGAGLAEVGLFSKKAWRHRLSNTWCLGCRSAYW